MSAEYDGKLDDDKTIPVMPRPMDRPSHRIRAEKLTSDPTGSLPTDNRQWWTGSDWRQLLALEASELQRRAFDDAIDRAFY